MILVQLLGGLGNQMFQYAAGRALAARHGVPLRLDTRWLTDTPRQYALGCFGIDATIATSAELFRTAVLRRLHFASRLQERGHTYSPSVTQAGKHTSLVGYWQSERYFSAIAPTIRSEFTMRNPPSARDAALLAEIGENQNAVSVHVRRGDYVSNPTTNAFHGLLPLDYYQQAIECLATRTSAAHYYVFSDEPEWARENLPLPGPASFINYHGPDDAHEDLRLMRACQYHIIANSSFSWWGAWLSDRPGKIVIAPRRWFQDTSMDASDICPPEWIRL